MSRPLTRIGLSARPLFMCVLLAFGGRSAQAGGTCSLGVPTPCASTTAPASDWNTDIWGLPGGDYPDNNPGGASGLWVELQSVATINLNINVLIRGLVVRPSATLLMTDIASGNLAIKSDGGGIINEGAIRVACDRTIDVPNGSFTLSENGSYDADPIEGVVTAASLTAQDVSVSFSGCGQTARLLISDAMTVTTTTGDLVLDGTGVTACPSSPGNGASRGGKTPPILRVASPSSMSASGHGSSAAGGFVGQLTIAGSFRMIEGADVCVGCGGPPGAAIPSIVVNGDFDNQSVLPSFFEWARGELIFPSSGTHTFEVAGLDLGSVKEGFNTDIDTPFDTDAHTNFSVDKIVLGDDGELTFENTFTNTVGTALGDEALYVRTLSLGSGSTVTVDGCTVYYCDLENGGANFVFINGGALVAAPCGIPTVSTWGLLALTGLLLCAGTVVCTRRLRRIAADPTTGR